MDSGTARDEATQSNQDHGDEARPSSPVERELEREEVETQPAVEMSPLDAAWADMGRENVGPGEVDEVYARAVGRRLGRTEETYQSDIEHARRSLLEIAAEIELREQRRGGFERTEKQSGNRRLSISFELARALVRLADEYPFAIPSDGDLEPAPSAATSERYLSSVSAALSSPDEIRVASTCLWQHSALPAMRGAIVVTRGAEAAFEARLVPSSEADDGDPAVLYAGGDLRTALGALDAGLDTLREGGYRARGPRARAGDDRPPRLDDVEFESQWQSRTGPHDELNHSAATTLSDYAAHYREMLTYVGKYDPSGAPDEAQRMMREAAARAVVILSRTIRYVEQALSNSTPPTTGDEDPRALLSPLRLLNENFACILGIGTHGPSDPDITEDLIARLASARAVDAALAQPRVGALLTKYTP